MNSDLRLRIIPAIIYVLVIVGATLLGSISSIILIQVFSLICIYEFIFNSYSTSDKSLKGRYVVGVILLGAILVNLVHQQYLWQGMNYIICLLFSSNAILIMLRGKSIFSDGHGILSAIALSLMPFLLTVNELLQGAGFSLILLGVFLILWLNDAGAYFVGRALGRNKIHPTISPGKTWEGWIGGVVLGMATSRIISIYITQLSLYQWLIIAMICGLMGIMGDLTESAWKRHHQIKDSGTIMPGHGGFLDRLDSFIYSIPFVILYLSL